MKNEKKENKLNVVLGEKLKRTTRKKRRQRPNQTQQQQRMTHHVLLGAAVFYPVLFKMARLVELRERSVLLMMPVAVKVETLGGHGRLSLRRCRRRLLGPSGRR